MHHRRSLLVAVLVLVLVMLLPATALAQPSLSGSLYALGASLSGEAEAPGPGDPDGFGFSRVTINADTGDLCYRISVAHIEPATAAHIHVAPPGEPGPVVVPLEPPGANGLVEGCTQIDRTLAAQILTNPGSYYVNVHNEEYPAGALRGQLYAISDTSRVIPPVEPTIEVVAEGLANPRHLNVGPDGTLYVAETGSGGDECMTLGEGEEAFEVCFGPTGEISRVDGDGATAVVSGLPSAAEPSGMFATGVHDVSIAPDGTMYAVIGEAAEFEDPSDEEEIPGLSSSLIQINDDGTWTVVADLQAYEDENNPDEGEDIFTGEPELISNPYAVLALEDAVYVIDASGNDLLRVADDGTVSTFAIFPSQTGTLDDLPPFVELPPDLPPDFTFPIQAVPTSIAVGPDGAFYVGTLTGFPFPPGGASVWRVMDENDDGDALDEGETSIYASGFTAIVDVDFDPDGNLYVLELARQGLLVAEMAAPDDEAAVTGALIQVTPEGRQIEVANTGLILPGGLEVTDDGEIYVSNFSIFPDESEAVPESGQVVRIDLGDE